MSYTSKFSAKCKPLDTLFDDTHTPIYASRSAPLNECNHRSQETAKRDCMHAFILLIMYGALAALSTIRAMYVCRSMYEPRPEGPLITRIAMSKSLFSFRKTVTLAMSLITRVFSQRTCLKLISCAGRFKCEGHGWDIKPSEVQLLSSLGHDPLTSFSLVIQIPTCSFKSSRSCPWFCLASTYHLVVGSSTRFSEWTLKAYPNVLSLQIYCLRSIDGPHDSPF